MERGLVFAHRALVEHEVLQRILETEPEILLPRLTIEADQTHTLVAAFLAPYLVRHGMAEGAELDAAADFLARMVLSYISLAGTLGPRRPRAGGAPRPVRAAGRHPVSASRPSRAAAALLPPPRPAGLGPLRALRPADLHRLHGAGTRSGGSAPPCTSEGAKRSRQVPAFTHTSPGRSGVVGSTNPTPVVLVIIAVNVVVFLLERFGTNTSLVDRYAI